MVGAAEKVTGLVKRGERIGICAGFGVEVEHVTIFIFKELVLQKMSDSFRNGAVVGIRCRFKLRIDRAVLCAEHGFGGAVALHFAD